MSSRPRRSAATKANEVISVHARMADSPERGERSTMSSRRSGRASGVSRDAHSPDSRRSLTVKVSNNSLRQSTRGASGRAFTGGEIVEGKRNRGARKSYVVDSSPEEDDEEEEEDEIEVENDDEDDEMDEDAEGEEEIDMDAEGEEDAEGDIEMDLAPPPPTIKVSKPSRSRPAPRASAAKVVPDDDDDDDDDLSDPADSDIGDQTMGLDETMVDEDAEGEEIEVAGEEVDDDEEEADSDDLGSQDEVDLTKMTKRQRARFEEEPQQHMKLSDEVQAKKVLSAEELSMRRQEMARRRRNLSEKRTEEVKMETINKLLKKQAPKINRKALAAAANGETVDGYPKPDVVFVRWVSNKNGVRVAVPGEIMESPVGTVFGGPRKIMPSKMVEEVV
ncbi:hypothetical protein QQX98_006422 [Neonectria punicea]|uniref:INO80 complex subunit B-like conserved region domain-containing protein n=1 Tax=Neonectria punicea TaxID=979145 RepID=A0ABR1H1B6_9HYPO